MSIEEFIDADQFAQDVAYSPSDIDTAVMQQAGFAAHYGVLAAQAKRQCGVAKIRLKTIEAKVYQEVRDNEAAKGGKKMSEAQVAAVVDMDKRVITAKMEYNNAMYQEELGITCMEAFRHRRDMLKEHGMNARTEKFSDPTVTVDTKEKEVMRKMQSA